MGIIGRNGAGKSTLLKILSRITEPTEGRAEIHGRVGSLLEVGTGFHSELTGRENIYLNGAILGMKKAEIERKFDEIVGFAEVEQFIDTPVKRYSSGMHMRLAFAVAAHLEPEILIVDEVLAVGDINFQAKCLGKMQNVSSQGRTILFVSHNMGAIGNLCSSAILLDKGQIVSRGEVKETVNAYGKSNTLMGDGTNRWLQHGGDYAAFTRINLLDRDGKPSSMFAMGDTIVVECDVEFRRPFPYLNMSVDIKRVESQLGVLHLLNRDSGFQPTGLKAGKYRFRVEIPNCLLYPGAYSITIWLQSPDGNDIHVPDAVTFSMTPSASCSRRTTPFYPHLGVVHMPSAWRQI